MSRIDGEDQLVLPVFYLVKMESFPFVLGRKESRGALSPLFLYERRDLYLRCKVDKLYSIMNREEKNNESD